MVQAQVVLPGESLTDGALIPSTTIERIVTARDAAIAEMEPAIEAFLAAAGHATRANELAEMAHGGAHAPEEHHKASPYKELFFTLRDPEACRETWRRKVDARVWSHVADLTGMRNLMDRTALEEFDKQLAGEVPEVTVDAIYATLEGFSEDARTIFLRGIARVFGDLDRRFKSHDAFKFNPKGRLIFRYIFDDYGHLRWDSWMHATLRDLERVFKIIDKSDDVNYSDAVRALHDDRQGSWGRRQSEVETGYFRIKGFMNGNAHFWFKRPDLVDRVNLLLAEYYGEVIPDAYTPDVDAVTPDDIKTVAGLPSKDLQFYASPETVCELLVGDGLSWRREASQRNPEGYPREIPRVLEPSAGTGNIIRRVFAQDPDAEVVAVELHPERAAALRAMRGNVVVHERNFLRMTPDPTFTHVFMNPPFYGTHWMEHVMHAFEFLAPGGILRAVLPITAELGESKKHDAFREWASERKIGWRSMFTDLPPESFKSSGTRINTVILELGRKIER